MLKKIKSSHIEMPAHLGSFPKALPIFGVDHPSLKNEDPRIDWEMRAKLLKDVFGFEGSLDDAGDRLVLQDKEGNRVIQIYKASDSFLYYDRRIVTPTDPMFADKILDYDTAKLSAHKWLAKFGFGDQFPFFEGMAYTGVSTVQLPEDVKASNDPPAKEYRTEIKPCFGFRINEIEVLGPGAKIMLSFAGNDISQVVYFWRRPVSKPIGDIAILPPEIIKKHLARDHRFAHLDANNSKIRINTIKLGYHASSPADFQRVYLPVYQFTGIVETRGGHNAQGFESQVKKKGSFVQEALQYHFNYFLSASSLTPSQYKLSGFPMPKKGSFIF
ncbi:MAG: hypothetical protein ACKVU0_14120 [Saprospiraceae bacterium]